MKTTETTDASPKTTPRTTPRQRARARREQIRRAAYRCFRDRGYHGTSVDAICEAAGISKGSFYWHYPSKQDVFVDILDQWGRQVAAELYKQFEEAVVADDYVEAVTQALLRETRRGRALVPLWIEFTLLSRTDPTIAQALAKFYRRARLAVVETLRPVAAEMIDDQDLDGLAVSMLGAYIGVVTQLIADPNGVDIEESFRRTTRVLSRLFEDPAKQLARARHALRAMGRPDDEEMPFD